jgi:hypothetical protein
MNTYDIGGYEIAAGQNPTERLPKWEVKFFVAICPDYDLVYSRNQ